MSLFALALMLGMKKIKVLSKPSVLIAVVITTLVSYAVGFAHKSTGTAEHIADPAARQVVASYADAQQRIDALRADVTEKMGELRALEKAHDARGIAELKYRIDLMNLEIAGLETQNKERMQYLRKLNFARAAAPENQPAMLYLENAVPEG